MAGEFLLQSLTPELYQRLILTFDSICLQDKDSDIDFAIFQWTYPVKKQYTGIYIYIYTTYISTYIYILEG